MSKISHKAIKDFAVDKINLSTEEAEKHRTQVRLLRERLEAKIAEDPSFNLVKMLHAGSVAKGTALRTVDDLDVAVYVKAGAAPKDDPELVMWLKMRLKEANPNLTDDQFELQPHCVTVHFNGSGLDVDMVPVLYEGDEEDRGWLIRKGTGERILTSIPLHLKFIRIRKEKYGGDYKQLILIAKWWKRKTGLRFKSFMIELLWSHLADRGLVLSDYPDALESFFAYIVKTQLKERIWFTDNYGTSELPVENTGAIEVFDPVNPNNNIVKNYADSDRIAIVEAAHAALDAIGEARYAVTKEEAVECWRDVLGKGFAT
jgi:hypothetical protein